MDGQLSFLQGKGADSTEEIFAFVAENYTDMSPIQRTFIPLDLDVLNNLPADDVGAQLAGVQGTESGMESAVDVG